MKVKMLKQTPFAGVYRKAGEVYDIVDRDGTDVTAQRWVNRGIAVLVPDVQTPKVEVNDQPKSRAGKDEATKISKSTYPM